MVSTLLRFVKELTIKALTLKKEETNVISTMGVLGSILFLEISILAKGLLKEVGVDHLI